MCKTLHLQQLFIKKKQRLKKKVWVVVVVEIYKFEQIPCVLAIMSITSTCKKPEYMNHFMLHL